MTNRQAAIRIIRRLRRAGFHALLAGGCVRDMLLGRRAKDWDVATDAAPDQIIRLFRRTRKIGAKFGVVMVMMDSQQIEVATFRTESGYSDGRRPDQVSFCNAAEDASRRDFTVNGMFYDPIKKQIIDYVDGKKDLSRRLLRTIGNPNDRFSEDYLRMLRAIRFSVQLGFRIEKPTWKAICTHSSKIAKISGERIAMELEAILTHPNRVKGIKLLTESGLANAIFPGFEPQVMAEGIKVLANLPKNVDFPLALAAWFADCETVFALDRCNILRLSSAHTKHMKYLMDQRGTLLNEELGLAQCKMVLASPYFHDLFTLQKAIQKALKQSTAVLGRLKRRAAGLKGKNLSPKPLLDGHELISLGIQPGPMVGLVAQEMYIAQLAEQINTPAEAREWVRNWLAEHHRRE
ncbi:MAG: CCA tRNA nucleotidyltransferase [Sedimentisphaerales bacterium]|nr:CCA tRNA nucleotidyltransferase [Sedimentisphaerales bacterium]